MNMASRITELKKKHEQLSEQVEKIQNSPGTDPLEVTSLKKQKLKIKEEITRLSS